MKYFLDESDMCTDYTDSSIGPRVVGVHGRWAAVIQFYHQQRNERTQTEKLQKSLLVKKKIVFNVFNFLIPAVNMSTGHWRTGQRPAGHCLLLSRVQVCRLASYISCLNLNPAAVINVALPNRKLWVRVCVCAPRRCNIVCLSNSAQCFFFFF